ncbi:aromatic acid exporter family protein [Streptomyces sp. NPDC050421]|uniref:aromatic acid exporter family protein n=1 Tax=Streptomyces sp. NPDC050421 TaxID=3365613 RepID=UPI0037AC6402
MDAHDGVRRRLRAAVREVPAARERVRAGLWPVLQQTGAATVAWLIARHLVQHHEPLFAPVAAVVALNASRGERGANAVRLLLGVAIGILMAELWLTVLGNHGYGALSVATFMAMLLALLLGGERIVVAQAAVSAILAVATSKAEAGPERLTDALIGAGVALLTSQIVFPAEPIALLRRAEVTTLRALAEALDLAALALRHRDRALSDQEVLDRLRTAREELVDLDKTRSRSIRTAGRSLIWRKRGAPALRESVSAGQLVLLGGSCLTLTRTAMTAHTGATRPKPATADAVRDLSRAVGELGLVLGDLGTRRSAVGIALGVLRALTEPGSGHDTYSNAVRVAVRTVAIDIMVFAGVDKDKVAEAERATEEQVQGLDEHVPAPVRTVLSGLSRFRRRHPRPGR